MAKTPTKQEISPTILRWFIFSLKKILEIRIMNIGEDEYIISHVSNSSRLSG